MTTTRIAILLSATLIFSGCAHQTSKLGSAETLDTAEVGYIAASLVSKQVSQDGAKVLATYPGMTAHFYTFGNRPEEAFVLSTTADLKKNGHWKDPVASVKKDDETRLMLLVPVRPGRYWLGNVNVEYFDGPGVRSVNLYTDHRSEVIVNKGEITYAGSIQVLTRIGVNAAGEARPNGSALRVSDDFAQDVVRMKAIDTRVGGLPLRDSLAK